MRLRWMMRKGNSLGLLPSLQRVRVGVGLGFVQKGESGGRPPRTARDLVRPGSRIPSPFRRTLVSRPDRPLASRLASFFCLPPSPPLPLPPPPRTPTPWFAGVRACVRARVSSCFGSFAYLSLSLPLGVDHAPQAVVKHVDSHHDCSCPLAPLLSVVVLYPPPGFRLDPLVERKESRRPPPPLQNEFNNKTGFVHETKKKEGGNFPGKQGGS